MGRLRGMLAALRVLLVAISLCLLGVTPVHASPTGALAADPRPAHVDRTTAPDQAPAITEERDEDDRSAPEDAATHGPRPGVVVFTATPQRVVMARGPPVDPRPSAGRPRSSRGPPARSDSPLLPV